MTIVVYLGHGTLHPVAVLFFSKYVFGRGLERLNWGRSEKKVAQLYPSTRPKGGRLDPDCAGFAARGVNRQPTADHFSWQSDESA